MPISIHIPKIHILYLVYLAIKPNELIIYNNNHLFPLHVQGFECEIHQLLL